ncbi:MAG: DUF2806 domain-containing protein [Fusobacterium sp.]|uniref:DUF2806 domain-containing protein n=1 Tax=Fusobacterium sp. TaxID=68766 RepID=UPI0039912454
MDINDGIKIVEAFVSPIEKLITTVSAGIGKVYEPTHIKRISNAIRDNIDIPIVYNDGKVSINSENFQELAQRASSRMAFQELTKQQNIDNIVYNAREELKNIKNVSEEPVDKDWVFRFFNSVENISNEDLQKIWGRILAGEIKTPNSYSYRALEVLKNMTPKEIEVFQKFISICVTDEYYYFISSNQEILKKYNLDFTDLLLLEECGLLSVQSLSCTHQINDEKRNFIKNDSFLSFISTNKKEIKEISFSIYILNKTGIQLLNAISTKRESEYVIDFLKILAKDNKDIDFTVHKIKNINENNEIIYEAKNLLDK